MSQLYEQQAAAMWERFYCRNEDKFYKDRHYFDREFPELCSGPATVVEVGCGAGNTVFPLLELNPGLRVFCCDFSPKAIELVKSHPAYAASGRVSAFVADLTTTDLSAHVPRGCADFVSFVFVLSAVAPRKMIQAVANAAQLLKPGGQLVFRDYAEGDLAQERREACL
ncbi:S-adenosyl-L-methionine-dependent methyltransferase [Haematococcus lacustris]